MRALTVAPGSAVRIAVEDVPEPSPSDGSILVETLLVGVCGTDREIVEGHVGSAPDGRDRWVIGHESLGRVIEAPAGSGFEPGDTVVGVVRLPDPVPCPHCAAGELDMCGNLRYTEHGIVGRDGFLAERFRLEPSSAFKIDRRLGERGVLMEPASVLAKAWEQVERIGGRALWEPCRVLVTGAGPIGLLAALMGMQRGLDVHVLDQVETGPKPVLVERLGARYHVSPDSLEGAFDVAIDCSGASALAFASLELLAPGGVCCLVGIGHGGARSAIDLDALNRDLVLNNKALVGSVSSNRRHFHLAHEALRKADPDWLGRLITDRLPIRHWERAFEPDPGRIKAVIEPR
jgi:glucose 1-dehydrogenase